MGLEAGPLRQSYKGLWGVRIGSDPGAEWVLFSRPLPPSETLGRLSSKGSNAPLASLKREQRVHAHC